VALRRAGGRDQLHRVLHQGRVHVDLPALALQLRELLGAGHRHDVDGRAGDALHDHEFLFVGRVVHQHLHHEAVDLRFRQRVGALGLDRVLRGHHQEGAGHLVALARDRDLPLLHHFEQRALHLGGGAVDLVGQQQVGEHRAQRGGELAGLLVVDPGAHQVRRHEVGRELDALELPRMVLASVLTVSVLARPGTPSTSRWPCASMATITRSRNLSCPTTTRLTSYRICSISCAVALSVRAVVSMILVRRDEQGGRQNGGSPAAEAAFSIGTAKPMPMNVRAEVG
jgi:hypothetical protein